MTIRDIYLLLCDEMIVVYKITLRNQFVVILNKRPWTGNIVVMRSVSLYIEKEMLGRTRCNTDWPKSAQR